MYLFGSLILIKLAGLRHNETLKPLWPVWRNLSAQWPDFDFHISINPLRINIVFQSFFFQESKLLLWTSKGNVCICPLECYHSVLFYPPLSQLPPIQRQFALKSSFHATDSEARFAKRVKSLRITCAEKQINKILQPRYTPPFCV